MAISVIMPALEMAQETGKVISWKKKEGERVTKGEALLEVETDKAVVEIEATGDGILAGVKAQEGAVVPVGQNIAWLVQPGEEPPKDSGAPVATGRTGGAATTAPAAATPAANAAAAPPAEIQISPKARRLAKELGVDLTRVRGSGAGGEILASDIEAASKGGAQAAPAKAAAAAATPSAIPPGGKTETPGVIGRLMAERTTQSWTSAPHFFVTREVDAGGMVALREKVAPEIEKVHAVKPTHTDLLVGLVARVLMKHPRINCSWTPEGIRIHPDANIGIAMAVEDGVVTAVVQKANSIGLAQIAAQRRDLTDRARANRLRPADISGATFTISNLGMYSVDSFTAIIVPPQAAILAVGAIADRVVPIDGNIGIRPMLSITLSCDHRVADGARGAAFLNDLAAAIREPEKLLG
jgi:pyruvate dehydrogenase E2 component (dihydrolipoamide acetyltransferase)